MNIYILSLDYKNRLESYMDDILEYNKKDLLHPSDEILQFILDFEVSRVKMLLNDKQITFMRGDVERMQLIHKHNLLKPTVIPLEDTIIHNVNYYITLFKN